MQVVLNKDVSGLGYRGDVVSVKNGYFRNFLMPEGLAMLATPGLMKVMEARKDKMVMDKQKLLDNAKDVLKDLKGLKLSVKSKASDKGKLYGAVTEEDVIKAVMEAKNIKLEKEYIKMEHFKEVGEYKVMVDLGDGMSEELNLVVEAE